MFIYVDRGAYWDCKEANIIFNPVSINNYGIFNQVIKKLFPKVFEEYREYMIGISKRKLLGEIHLVQLEEQMFIMNAYVYENEKLNYKALTKALIEMSNLLEEYHITGALRSTFGSKNKIEYEDLETIISTVLKDNRQDIYIFKPTDKNKKK